MVSTGCIMPFRYNNRTNIFRVMTFRVVECSNRFPNMPFLIDERYKSESVILPNSAKLADFAAFTLKSATSPTAQRQQNFLVIIKPRTAP